MRLKVFLALLAVIIALPPQHTQAARRRTRSKAVKRKKTVVQPSLAAGYEALAKNDANGAIDLWRPLFKMARSEITTHTLWPQFVQLCLENGRLVDLESAANDADSPDSSPELRAAARLVVRRAAWRENRTQEARDLDEKLNFIRDWQTIGPLENEEQIGFENNALPEREDTFNRTIEGRDGKPLRWRTVPISREGECLTGRFLGDEKAGVFYAATAFNAPAARTIQLRFNHVGAAKMWLNGKLIFSDAKLRNAQNVDPDVFVLTQKVQAGWNSVFVKIAAQVADEAFFSLRLTNEKGANLTSFQTDPTHFKWQNLNGSVEPAPPQLIKALGTPRNEAEKQNFAFAQRFLGESKLPFPAIPLFSAQQIALRQKAVAFERQGKRKEAIGAYNDLLKTEEFAPDVLQNLARLQKQQGDNENASASLKKLRNYRPQDAEIAAQYAELLRERGDKNGALAIYQQAVAIDPSKTMWREKVRVLSGEKSLLDLVPDAPMPVANSAQKADSILLLDEARQIVYDDRATLTRFHQIIQINSTNSARRYENFILKNPSPSATLTIESAKVISAGKVSDVLRNNETNSLKISTLIAGDIIDISYCVEENQRGVLGRQFWAQWFFNLAQTPVLTSRFVLLTPPQVPFNIRSHGDVPAPQRSQIKNGNTLWDVREWRMENLAARPIEPLGVASQDVNLWIDISSIVTWKTIANWYQEANASRASAVPSVRAKALELTKNARTEEEKLRALHAYVARELREKKSVFGTTVLVAQAAQQTMRLGYGEEADKAALLIALCDSVGIKARFALFNSRSEGLTPFLPSPRFNHVMVVAQTQSGEVWLDNNAEIDSLAAENQGVQALIVESQTSELSTTPILAPEGNIAATKSQATLEETGQLKGTIETSLSGQWGDNLRLAWNALGANQRAEFTGTVGRFLMPSVQIAKITAHNFAVEDQPLKIQVAFERKDLPSTGTELMFQMPWPELASVSKTLLNSSISRTQECEVTALRGLSLDTLKLQLPPGFVPQDLPEEIKDTSPFGRYRFTYKSEGEGSTGATLIVTREVLMTPLRVSVEDAAAYMSFCKTIGQESARKIVLKK